MSKRKAYRPKLISIPMSKALYDEFGMQMHMALATLRTAPCADAWDCLSAMFNVVASTITEDKRFTHEAVHLYSGMRMMQQIGAKCELGLPLKDHELACIFSAVSVMDDIVPRLDVSKLHLSNLKLRGAI